MPNAGPTRASADLADVVELLLDKGLVVNADITVSVGDTELLGIQIRAAVASFETAAQYGLEFPEGTDQDRIEQVANRNRLGPAAEGRFETVDDGVSETPETEIPGNDSDETSNPEMPGDGGDETSADETDEGGDESDDD